MSPIEKGMWVPPFGEFHFFEEVFGRRGRDDSPERAAGGDGHGRVRAGMGALRKKRRAVVLLAGHSPARLRRPLADERLSGGRGFERRHRERTDGAQDIL